MMKARIKMNPLKKLEEFYKKNFVEKKNNVSIFSESSLKTSFYEELQKNGWCEIVSDKPDDLMEIVTIKVRKIKSV